MQMPNDDGAPTGLGAPLPEGLELVRITDEFDEHTVPAGLLRDHRVAAGVWGQLIVRSGSLRFAFGDGAEFAIAADQSVVIPPEQVHHVVLDGAVRFVVEFHRPAGTVES